MLSIFPLRLSNNGRSTAECACACLHVTASADLFVSRCWNRKRIPRRPLVWRLSGCRQETGLRFTALTTRKNTVIWSLDGECMHGKGTYRSGMINWRQLTATNGNKKHRVVLLRAFDPRGGGGGGSGAGRVIFNLAMAGLLTYLTVTGKLAGLFEAILSIWLFVLVATWFTERKIIKGPCPNCGNDFQVLEFAKQEEPRLCPYCSQPFRLENRQFVREAPRFSTRQSRDFRQPFGGFGQNSTPKEQDTPGVVVDIEAEVRDKE